jgi:hypothetical protein
MNTLSSPSPAKSFAWMAAEPEAEHETIRNDEPVRIEECVQALGIPTIAEVKGTL